MSNKDVKQDALDNLADALTEDILNTPDDELLREVAEDYGDPHALANKFDQILERAEKQVFGTARPRSSVLDLLYRLLEWSSTLFGRLCWSRSRLLVLGRVVIALFGQVPPTSERRDLMTKAPTKAQGPRLGAVGLHSGKRYQALHLHLGNAYR